MQTEGEAVIWLTTEFVGDDDSHCSDAFDLRLTPVEAKYLAGLPDWQFNFLMETSLRVIRGILLQG